HPSGKEGPARRSALHGTSMFSSTSGSSIVPGGYLGADGDGNARSRARPRGDRGRHRSGAQIRAQEGQAPARLVRCVLIDTNVYIDRLNGHEDVLFRVVAAFNRVTNKGKGFAALRETR